VCREKDDKRSAILVSDLDGSDLNLFASGLRNTVFFDFDAQGRMWGNDMGRDFLGDDLPPDELNIIEAGRDYGWPYCYGKNVRDNKFDSGNTINCAESQGSTYDYPAHIAPLGVRFINSEMFSEDSQDDLLSVFHGSWNSSTPVGYKIVKLDVSGKEVLEMEDFISGWLKKDGDVLGRPVDLIFDNEGYLYISDDKANIVYILSKETNQQ
jgi:glucose/arabinose dehydrogenase